MRFFHTLREKEFILKRAKRGNLLPAIKYLLYRLRLSRYFTVKRSRYMLRIFYSPLAFWLWTHKDTEKSDEQFYASFLKKGDIVIDCGAHIGTLALTASDLVGDDGKVIACEMHPRTFSYLAANVRENKRINIELHNVAIGDRAGAVPITDEYVSDINHISDEGTITMPMRTIDSIAEGLPRVDLLKLDIEGYELQTLRGSSTTLPRTKAVYFEAAPRNFERYGYTLKEILVLLQQEGFTCYAFDEGGNKKEITVTYSPTVKYENILALRA